MSNTVDTLIQRAEAIKNEYLMSELKNEINRLEVKIEKLQKSIDSQKNIIDEYTKALTNARNEIYKLKTRSYP